MTQDRNADNLDKKDLEERRRTSQYNDTFITGLQWLWGDGNMAPGGTDDLGEMLGGIDSRNKSVLDVGSGLGAIAIALVRDYQAASVIGVDVEPHLVEHSRERARKAGLADKVSFEQVTPGTLPFKDNSFDIVVTKDAIVHIPDKAQFYKDILRVLKPGGAFAGSDWLRKGQGTCVPTLPPRGWRSSIWTSSCRTRNKRPPRCSKADLKESASTIEMNGTKRKSKTSLQHSPAKNTTSSPA